MDVANVNGPLALIVRLSPPLFCSTRPLPLSPARLPPIVRLAGGLGVGGLGSGVPPPPPPPPQPTRDKSRTSATVGRSKRTEAIRKSSRRIRTQLLPFVEY